MSWCPGWPLHNCGAWIRLTWVWSMNIVMRLSFAYVDILPHTRDRRPRTCQTLTLSLNKVSSRVLNTTLNTINTRSPYKNFIHIRKRFSNILIILLCTFIWRSGWWLAPESQNWSDCLSSEPGLGQDSLRIARSKITKFMAADIARPARGARARQQRQWDTCGDTEIKLRLWH